MRHPTNELPRHTKRTFYTANKFAVYKNMHILTVNFSQLYIADAPKKKKSKNLVLPPLRGLLVLVGKSPMHKGLKSCTEKYTLLYVVQVYYYTNLLWFVIFSI